MSTILRNVSRGSFFLAAEQLSALAGGFVYSIIVLRWLGPWTYGMLSLGLAIVGLASVATGNFEVFLERYAAEYEARRDMARLARAHFLALGLKLGLGVLAAGALVLISGWLAGRYHEPILQRILWVLAGLTLCEAFTVTGRAVLFGLQRFGWMAAVALVAQALKIAAVLVLWIKGQGLILLAVLLVGLGAVQGVALTLLALAMVRRGRAAGGAIPVPEIESPAELAAPVSPAELAAPAPAREGALLPSILRYCLPLLAARAAFLSGQNLSRVVLGAFMNLEQLGFYSFAATLVDRFVALVYAIPSSLLPSFTQLLARGDRTRFVRLFDKSFRLIATAAALLSAFLFLFARELTLVVGGYRYVPAIGVLAVLGLVPWARTAQQPVTMAFYALRRTGRVLGLALLKLATEIGAYFLLIPMLGLPGAAWATVSGAVLSLIAALVLLSRDVPASAARWRVMLKTTALIMTAVAATGALAAAGAGHWVAFGVKAAAVAPALLFGVFLLDLVTQDDLARARGVEIRPAWARFARDRVIAGSLAVSRLAGARRPGRLATLESD